MIGQQIQRQEERSSLIEVTETAQGELAKALKSDTDQPNNIRLVIQGFG